MDIKFGDTSLSNVYLGDSMASKVYLGSNVIWEHGSEEEPIVTLIDFSQETAPTLPSYITVDGQGTYYFKHRECTSGMGWRYYGLTSTNTNKSSTTAYTRYKYVAPKDGTLKFNYGCSADSGDCFTIHVNKTNTQPSYDSTTNRIAYASNVNDYYGNSTAKINVVENETYYIHVQYYKDSSGNGSYDCGFITKIELAELEEETYLIDFTQSTAPTLPNWFIEDAKDSSYYFKHKTCNYASSVYGLCCGASGTTGSTGKDCWSCYKLVAPKTGTINIGFRLYSVYSTSALTIHVTSDNTKPSTSDATGVILREYGSDTNYKSQDGFATLDVTKGETYYIHFQYYYYRYSSSSNTVDACIRTIEFIPAIPIKSINGFSYSVDVNNVEQSSFVVEPIISPNNYSVKDLEIIYDSNYMSINPTTFAISLKDGCQGMSHTVTYRGVTNNISKPFTFYVNPSLEFPKAIDFTQSTAPTLPDFMTVDYNSTYSFSHGTFTTDVYGLIPSNKGKKSTTAYTRYKYVAPKSGTLKFTYRCSSESNYDFFTIHVDTSTSQPSYSSSTNQIIKASGTTYASTDGTASVSVVEGTTYYIHVQYRKDSSGDTGYDRGCIRTIELV